MARRLRCVGRRDVARVECIASLPPRKIGRNTGELLHNWGSGKAMHGPEPAKNGRHGQSGRRCPATTGRSGEARASCGPKDHHTALEAGAAARCRGWHPVGGQWHAGNWLARRGGEQAMVPRAADVTPYKQGAGRDVCGVAGQTAGQRRRQYGDGEMLSESRQPWGGSAGPNGPRMSRVAASASPRLRARPLTAFLRHLRPTEPATTLPPASTAGLLLAAASSCLRPLNTPPWIALSTTSSPTAR